MRNLFLVSIALGLGFTGGCAAGSLPEGLTVEEAQRLGIGEGVAGRAALRTGNCAPGCVSDCDISPPGVTLRAVPVSGEFFPAKAETCQLSIVESDQYLSFPATSLGSTEVPSIRLERETYALPLAPGRYVLALIDEQGCAQCVRRGEDSFDATPECEVTEVLPGQVSVVDVLLDEGAE